MPTSRPEATLFLDSFTAQAPSDRYEVLISGGDRLVRWSDVSDKVRPDGVFATIGDTWVRSPAALLDEIEVRHVGYVLLSRYWIDAYHAEREAYPEAVRLYDALVSAYPVVETFDRDDGALGWDVLILRVA